MTFLDGLGRRLASNGAVRWSGLPFAFVLGLEGMLNCDRKRENRDSTSSQDKKSLLPTRIIGYQVLVTLSGVLQPRPGLVVAWNLTHR